MVRAASARVKKQDCKNAKCRERRPCAGLCKFSVQNRLPFFPAVQLETAPRRDVTYNVAFAAQHARCAHPLRGRSVLVLTQGAHNERQERS
jgi:hypothetical protein